MITIISTVDPSIPDTLGPERTVLVIKVSSFQGKDVLRQSIINHLVPVACVHIRGVSAIQGAGFQDCPIKGSELEGCL